MPAEEFVRCETKPLEEEEDKPDARDHRKCQAERADRDDVDHSPSRSCNPSVLRRALTRTTIYRTRSLFLSCTMPSAPRWLEAVNKALTHPDNKGKIGT